jgi:hypothetical protein
MGGGDLNMKKSWHPLLQKNQERVWQEENRAREERKRIEQKRKEIAEERQVQELRRLQEQQGGKKTVERLDWMYVAPGSGGQNTNESMEAYLLGKKKVDELITGDENEKLKKGGDVGFVAMQNANSATDTRNKILNDPLLAIKKQEQRQFEELMKNPLRLKQMKKELEKAKGGKEKSHRHHDSHRDSERHSSERHNSERHNSERHNSERHNSERHRHSDRGVKRHRDRDDDSYRSSKSRRNDTDRSRPEIKQEHSDRYNDRRRDRSPVRPSSHRSPRIKREPETPTRNSPAAEDARAAALQAMLTNAEDLESSRAVRLAALEAKETAESEREELERLKKKALGGRAGFMKDMQGRILEEGRMAVVR